MDEPGDRAQVLDFLKSKGADFDNLISQHGASPATAEEFGFRGDLPFYQLFDRTGKLVYQFSPLHDDLPGGEPVDQIDMRVQELLGQN